MVVRGVVRRHHHTIAQEIARGVLVKADKDIMEAADIILADGKEQAEVAVAQVEWDKIVKVQVKREMEV
jgi:hypothetical protein